MRKRDKVKRLTREQIERLMATARKTWMSLNNILKDGKWRDEKDKDKIG